MSKVTLTFDTFEDAEELKDALAATKNAILIEDIWQRCFRPAFKNGFSEAKIQDIIENSAMDYINEDGEEANYALDLIDHISQIYLNIVNDD